MVLELILLACGKIGDFIFGKVLGALYNALVVPLLVFCKKHERREFAFESTLHLEGRVNFSSILAALKERYDLQQEQGKDFNEFFCHFKLNKVNFKLTAFLNADYGSVKTGDRKEQEQLPLDSLTLRYECSTLLKEVKNNCNVIKGQLEKTQETISMKTKQTFAYTHNRLLFDLKRDAILVPVYSFKDVDRVEIVLSQGKIKLSKRSGVIELNTWLFDEEMEDALVKMLVFVCA